MVTICVACCVSHWRTPQIVDMKTWMNTDADANGNDTLEYWEKLILSRLISSDAKTTNLLTLQSLLWYFASLPHARRQKILSSCLQFSFLLEQKPHAYLSDAKTRLLYSYGIYTNLFFGYDKESTPVSPEFLEIFAQL